MTDRILIGPAGPEAPVRVGTRGSRLAVAQTTQVAEALAAASGRQVEIVRVTTHGDVNRASLSTLGGQGVFATELREALRQGEVDVAVHSLKDLPTAPAPGLRLAAHPVREDARDALCARDGLRFDELPEGAKVGTGSPRRIAQLRRMRPDLELHDIRGNIDTRLGFVESGELDAVLLACAGLERLGRTDAITERFDLERMPTAPGQGALAVETRDEWELPGLDGLDDAATRAAVDAERCVLNGLDAGCSAPVAAHAKVEGRRLALHAIVFDGERVAEARGGCEVDLATVLEASTVIGAGMHPTRASGEVPGHDVDAVASAAAMYPPAALAAKIVAALFEQGVSEFRLPS